MHARVCQMMMGYFHCVGGDFTGQDIILCIITADLRTAMYTFVYTQKFDYYVQFWACHGSGSVTGPSPQKPGFLFHASQRVALSTLPQEHHNRVSVARAL